MSKIRVIQKIKKLMIHERSARLINSIPEADNFKARIEALRKKHNITQEIPIDELPEMNPADGYFAEPVFDMHSPLYRNKRIFWEEAVINAVAGYFNCRAIVLKSSNLKIVIGEPADRKKAISSYLYLYDFALREATAYNKKIKAAGEKLSPSDYRLNRDSFLYGFSYGLQQRLALFMQADAHLKLLQTEAGGDQKQPESGALVKSERIAVTEQRQTVEEELSKIKSATGPKISVIDSDALTAGYDKALECALSDEIELCAKKIAEELTEVQERLQSQHDERMRSFYQSRGIFSYGYAGDQPPSSNKPTQMNFLFDEVD